ncbi:hypothetical protein MNV49_007258 [Pseudohyphozyma bogoriensis]|nr:hypothetical protein MNV49_007258 [Pseudohyphozyma bogoriensis]
MAPHLPLDSPLRRYPRLVLTVVFFFVSLFLISLLPSFPSSSSGKGTSSAPSLSERLRVSEEMWESSVKQRHELMTKFGEALDPFPTSNPLPYYVLWNFFTPSFNCPFEMRRVGTIMDGGRWVCGLSRLQEDAKRWGGKNCILGESSFEAEILETTKCKVYGYDYRATRVHDNPAAKPRAFFFPYKIEAVDAHTADPPRWTLRNLMKAHGHKHISILRVDVEGKEFGMLREIIADYRSKGEPLPFGQLQVEIHALGKGVQEMVEWWEELEEAGLRAFMTEPNLVFANFARKDAPPGLAEYSFINVKEWAETESDEAVYEICGGGDRQKWFR